jgi:hypothetical protein
MPKRLLPNALALSADNLRDNARAKAVRASYEFWSTGDEALCREPFWRGLIDSWCKRRRVRRSR